MSVLVVTSLGELVLDLYVSETPQASKNFLKLCQLKYYNGCLFFNVLENLMVQSGDPTGTGTGGNSLNGILYGEQARYFPNEILPHLKHNRKGLLSMANSGEDKNTSQFFITCRDTDLEHLDGKHTIFGEVAEGMEVLEKLNVLYVDESGRPYQDIRILHTYVLDDPFDDPPLMPNPCPSSPTSERPKEETVTPRLAADINLDEKDSRTEEEIEKSLKEKEAKSRAVVLEMIGDIPDADVKPPDEVLFVCKLNNVTTSEDLKLIFSRFGPCKCEVIKDYKTGDSLCYAFIEFTEKKHCEQAYFKMNNVLIDDRRIKVDFSQSVSKLWNKFARRPWEKHTKEDGEKYLSHDRQHSNPKKSPQLGDNLRWKRSRNAEEGSNSEILLDTNEMVESSRKKKKPSYHHSSNRHRSRSRSRGRHRHSDYDKGSSRSQRSHHRHKSRSRERRR